jgi:hypothetical protein
MKLYKVIITGLFIATLLCSCEKDHKVSLKGLVGKTCHVQLKRNALGGATSNPVSAQTDNINGADVSIVGILKGYDKESVTITQGGRETWIPRDSILLIQADQ